VARNRQAVRSLRVWRCHQAPVARRPSRV